LAYAVAASFAATAQEASETPVVDIEQIVVTGTRVPNRTNTETAVPVDVVSSTALVNVNGTVGRGSAAVDLNTIPSSIVQSIEVLRDGAAAQYGSDAIAGVIN